MYRPFGSRRKNFVWYVANRFPLGDGITVGADDENGKTDDSGFRSGRASRATVFVSLGF